MASINTISSANDNYIDFSYKGYQVFAPVYWGESTVISKTYPSLLVSTSQYPLGYNTQLYPDGGLIPLQTVSADKIRLAMQWKYSGSSSVYFGFFDSNKDYIPNSGISIANTTEYTTTNFITSKPPSALYVSMYNPNGGSVTVESFGVYALSVQKPESTSPLLLTKVEALVNAFKLWLFSKKGDFGRKINLGGPLDFILNKPITSETTELIRKTLVDLISTKYLDMTVNNVLIEENKESRSYKITVILIDYVNKFITETGFLLSD